MTRTRQGEFTWIDLVAKDLETQTMFYEGLFGWTHVDMPTDVGPVYRMFQKDGKTVAGASQISPDMEAAGVPSMWNTYIAADDVDALAARAVELGGKIAMPAMDVMDQGRMVGVQDPTGASFFFWKAMQHNGAELYQAPGALAWSELDTRDPAKAADFYRKLLGWKIEQLPQGAPEAPPYWQVSLDSEPAEGGIMGMPEMVPAQVPAYWLVYFGADDAKAMTERAKSLGATPLMDTTEIPGMLVYSILTDTVGATFGILQGTM